MLKRNNLKTMILNRKKQFGEKQSEKGQFWKGGIRKRAILEGDISTKGYWEQENCKMSINFEKKNKKIF